MRAWKLRGCQNRQVRYEQAEIRGEMCTTRRLRIFEWSRKRTRRILRSDTDARWEVQAVRRAGAAHAHHRGDSGTPGCASALSPALHTDQRVVAQRGRDLVWAIGAARPAARHLHQRHRIARSHPSLHRSAQRSRGQTLQLDPVRSDYPRRRRAAAGAAGRTRRRERRRRRSVLRSERCMRTAGECGGGGVVACNAAGARWWSELSRTCMRRGACVACGCAVMRMSASGC